MELRNSHRAKKDKGRGTIVAGDIVVVHDESQSRALWRLGKVERLINGADGNVRGKQPMTLRRPMQLLYPLEVRSTSEAEETQDEEKEIVEPVE